MPISTTALSGVCVVKDQVDFGRYALPEMQGRLPINCQRTHRWVWPQSRPIAVHPPSVPKPAWLERVRAGPHVLFYGHYDVQTVDPLSVGTVRPETAVTTMRGRKISQRAGRGRQGSIDDLRRSLPSWKSVTGSFAVEVTMVIEGERKVGSKIFRSVS